MLLLLIEAGSRMRVLPAPGNGEFNAPLIGTLSGSRADTLLLLAPGETTPRKVPLAQAHEWRYPAVGERTRGEEHSSGRCSSRFRQASSRSKTSETCTAGCVYHNPASPQRRKLLCIQFLDGIWG